MFPGSPPSHGHHPPAGGAPQEEGAFWNLCALQSTLLDPSWQRISCRERVSPGPPATLEREGRKYDVSVGTLACHLVHFCLLVKVKSDKGKLCQHLHVTMTYLRMNVVT